jgi:hypothetical protein
MKILLLECTVVNYGDDRGGVIEAAGALVNPAASTAHALVNQGCALYTAKADDPSKGLKTAPADVIAAAEAAAKAAAKAIKAAKPAKPEGAGGESGDGGQGGEGGGE